MYINNEIKLYGYKKTMANTIWRRILMAKNFEEWASGKI